MQKDAGRHEPLSYVPLRTAGPVLLHRNACLQLRSCYAGCGHCERVCPVSALEIRDGKMRLGGDCLGCGRCVAACPTGALRVRGFAAPVIPNGNRPVAVDCLRAPKSADVRVPCLGGLSASSLLALWMAAGERTLELLDRGWCAACPAAGGAGEHSLAARLARVQGWLRDAGVPDTRVPRLRYVPLPASRGRSQATLAPDLRRRSVVAGITETLQANPAQSRFHAAAAPERERVLAALARTAARYGGRVSQQLYNGVELDLEACSAHGVCAAGCPTGALRLEPVEPSGSVLSHSSALCIGCGHCERVCAQRAIRLVGGGGNPEGARGPVAKFTANVCEGCGARLLRSSVSREAAVCERCLKRSALARAAFQQIHGPGAVQALAPNQGGSR